MHLPQHNPHAGIKVSRAVLNADTFIIRTAVMLIGNHNADILILYQLGSGKCANKVFSISCVQRRLSEAASSSYMP